MRKFFLLVLQSDGNRIYWALYFSFSTSFKSIFWHSNMSFCYFSSNKTRNWKKKSFHFCRYAKLFAICRWDLMRAKTKENKLIFFNKIVIAFFRRKLAAGKLFPSNSLQTPDEEGCFHKHIINNPLVFLLHFSFAAWCPITRRIWWWY